jgi:hypothetical protein
MASSGGCRAAERLTAPTAEAAGNVAVGVCFVCLRTPPRADLAGGVCAVPGRGHGGEDREGQDGTIQH